MTATDPASALAAIEPSPRDILVGRMLSHRAFIFGSAVFTAMALFALLGPFLVNYGPFEQDLPSRLTPPSWFEGGEPTHLLGTDHLGRDYLTRLIYGAQISLLIGVSVALISGLIGTVLGIVAGYVGGWVDNVIMFVVTTRLAMPVILVALAVVALVGSSLTTVILVLGLLLWDRYALVVRSATMQIRAMEFVDAAKAQGASTARLLFKEIMPNIASNLIIVATLEMAQAVMMESALSFLGLGVPPPTPSWGIMIAEGREYLLFDPWLITIPGVMLFLLVLSINLVGDGIRDITSVEGR